MPRKDHRVSLALGIALLSILPYLNGLRNGFTFDDVPIVAENMRLRSPAGVASIFVSDWWWGTRPMGRVYRPLAMSSFAMDYTVAVVGAAEAPPARLSDASAFPFHVQNLAWHAMASAALLLLVLELFASPALAGIAAALFAVHPVHTEAVDGIVGRAELMAACFAFLALIAAARAIRGTGGGVRQPALAGVFFILALLSKEQAVVVPAVVLIGLVPIAPGSWRERLGGRAVRHLFVAFAIALIAYLSVRTAVLGSVTGVGVTPAGAVNVDNPIAGTHGLARLATPVRVFGEVLRLLVVPRTLSADYSFDQIPVVSSIDAVTVGCLIALCGLAAAGLLLRRSNPAASFGILFFIVTWGLTSNVLVTIGTILGERLLYFPSAGACLATAALLTAASQRLRAPWFAPAAASILVVLGAGRSWARNADWKDNMTLFASTARTSPRSCKAQNAYASELYAHGRAREALPWAERALAIYPRYPEAHLTLSKIDRELADEETDPRGKNALRDRARQHARMAVDAYVSVSDIGTGLADAWNTLAALSLDAGDLDTAERAYRASLKSSPDFLAAVNGLGVVLTRRGRAEEALAQFERALTLDPSSTEARQNAAAALRGLAAQAPAEAAASELIRRADAHEATVTGNSGGMGDAAARANLHGVRGQRFLGEKRYNEALAEFREAARLEPGGARALLGVGSALAAQADAEPDPNRRHALAREAIASFTSASQLEPDNAEAHLDLGIAYLRYERDPAKVAEHFRAYLRLAPEAPQRVQMEQTIREMEALAAGGGR